MGFNSVFKGLNRETKEFSITKARLVNGQYDVEPLVSRSFYGSEIFNKLLSFIGFVKRQ